MSKNWGLVKKKNSGAAANKIIDINIINIDTHL